MKNMHLERKIAFELTYMDAIFECFIFYCCI